MKSVGTSRITLCVSARALLALLLLGALGLVFTACGDDDDGDTAAETTPTTTAPAPVTTPPPETPDTTEKPDPDTEPRTVPEEQQGDEEAIRSEAVFTGRNGRLTPREVRVPAFIAIRVILRSADGGSYSLTMNGKRLAIEGDGTDELELDGLLPDRSYEGKSPQGNVRVVASAEPGP